MSQNSGVTGSLITGLATIIAALISGYFILKVAQMNKSQQPKEASPLIDNNEKDLESMCPSSINGYTNNTNLECLFKEKK